MAHGPGDERARPWPARVAPVPVGMAAASPVVADLAGERLAALADAAAIDIAVDLTAIDDGRAAEPGPFLPRRIGDAIGRRTVGIARAAAAAAATAAQQPRQDDDEQEDRWQPVTECVGGTQGGWLPASTNVDGGDVEIHV